MTTPVLAGKLYIPPPPPKAVARQRLMDRLNEGLNRASGITLISAPAGFGKTTLISEWIAKSGRSVAWLSLDQNDQDPAQFLIYLTSALQAVSPNLGAGILEALNASQLPPVESVLIALLNEISIIPGGVILVLDDYHLADSKSIDQALTFLVEHLPPQTHLVITSREDPNLPLPRLRVRNQLVELRASDLRFTPSEASEFLNQVMGLNLTAEIIAALETRTEGWIAGLQLAALSMRGQQDIQGFVQAFAGDHHYIVDYLVQEVLQRQPESTKNFLLQTSILERLNGPLCDAVTTQPGSKLRLEQLQRGNLFLIPLDDKRDWYRYHHLFADVLRVRLATEQPDQVPVLHRRASEWYEQNGQMADAIRHALIGADWERAAALVERTGPAMRQSRQESTLLGWLKALPDELFQDRPVLHVLYIGALLQNGQFAGVESRLRHIDHWLATPEDIRPRPVYEVEADYQRLPGSVAMYQAAMALAQGDVVNAMNHARRVLDLAPEDDNFMRGAASSLLGLASWTDGDLTTAYQMFSKGMNHLEKVGFISDVIGGCITLADLQLIQGHLHEALSAYERGLQLATTPGTPALRGAADMHVGLSGLYLERNDLKTAAQHLLKCQELGELNGLPKNPYRWRVATARLREAQGELDAALDLINAAEGLYVSDFSPNFSPTPALRARIWIRQGELGKARQWARERKLSLEEEPSYLREYEQITFARILLSQTESDQSQSLLPETIRFLNRLLKAAEDGGRVISAIEILVLSALAYQTQGDLPAALAALARALKLAEPEGYVRIFLDEGTTLEALLRKGVTRGNLPNYASRLISAFEAERKGQANETPPASPAASATLVEPLSQRELDILRLFKTEMSGPEIAQELVIALSTVRTHTKSIYSKLGVNSRRSAVKRASDLGLI